ncbi:sialate O-acetylesterase [Pedobacter jamesrossensis]|uniref:Sialate O-acetylesterase n=1 Tax=Pedobacter jamesrossensis TaxID=1908238 RepID=A0ABV8NSN1_9SPHI
MSKIIIFIFTILASINFKAYPLVCQISLVTNSNDESKSHHKSNVWIFIMAGQSNMAGRAKVEPLDTITNKRILVMQPNGKITIAKEPLHLYEPAMVGLDCGLSFGKQLLKSIPDSISILLVPTAVGGSSINQWLGDSLHRGVKLHSNFKKLLNLSIQHGTVKGILWHQGESDANQVKVKKYQQKLIELFLIFRKEVNNDQIPILTGEIGAFSEQVEYQKQINKSIRKNANKDPYTFLVRTNDLAHKGDQLHFDAKSQRQLGERFAKIYSKNFK